MQGEEQGIGAGGAADSMGSAAIMGDFLFQGGHLRPENHQAGSQHPSHRLFDLRPQLSVLGLKVAQRHRCSERHVHPPTPPANWPLP